MIAIPQLFTSTKEDWETPGSIKRRGTFFYNLHDEFNFDLDAAAHEMNAKLPNYLTEDDDALSIKWPGRRSWCNPPYGFGSKVGKWITKFGIEYVRKDCLVALVAARTDTQWFHDVIWTLADEVRLVRGRLNFEVNGKPAPTVNKKTGLVVLNKDGTPRPQPATFPSMVIVFRRKPIYRSEVAPLVRTISPTAEFIDGEAPI